MTDWIEQLRGHLANGSVPLVAAPAHELRESAVLVPLFARANVPYALFTKRPSTLRSHAGQISFPGGTREPSDSTPLHTALRETKEELGIEPTQVQVLGMLAPISTVTGYRIAPFVGLIPPNLVYRPSPEEIEEVIEAPLAELMMEGVMRVERREMRGEWHDIHFYDYGRHTIWGATARILNELLSLLSHP